MTRLIDSSPACPAPTPPRAGKTLTDRGLVYDAAVKAEADDLYPKVAEFVTPMEWPPLAPLVAAHQPAERARKTPSSSRTIT